MTRVRGSSVSGSQFPRLDCVAADRLLIIWKTYVGVNFLFDWFVSQGTE